MGHLLVATLVATFRKFRCHGFLDRNHSQVAFPVRHLCEHTRCGRRTGSCPMGRFSLLQAVGAFRASPPAILPTSETPSRRPGLSKKRIGSSARRTVRELSCAVESCGDSSGSASFRAIPCAPRRPRDPNAAFSKDANTIQQLTQIGCRDDQGHRGAPLGAMQSLRTTGKDVSSHQNLSITSTAQSRIANEHGSARAASF
jgi:hypothetical protein